LVRAICESPVETPDWKVRHTGRLESLPVQERKARSERQMNYSLTILEMAVVALGLGLLLLDLWTPVEKKRDLGYLAAGLLGLILIGSFKLDASTAEYAFGKMYLLDGLALFFKRFFLVSALIVLLMSVEFADCIESGIAEFYALMLFALAGMLFAASANDFALLFVSLELIPSHSMC